MGKGFYISKAVAVTCVVVAIAAVATIIALSVVYAQEKSKNEAISPPTANPDTTTVTPTTPSTPKEPWQRYRLPDSLAPVSYNVTLWPRLKPNADGLYIFTGHSTVVFKCVKETDLILIHSNRLNLTAFEGYHAKLKGLNGATAPSLKKNSLNHDH
ncbi:aminopeptidase Ey-like protein [Lates japonicus]|uniref:Aminopeptidase Ey-like protein n=1 Tax=Lates japonicus TaxID=270547 RepID=A0AAD3R559_LATJO|nr:aminopeptidase Ey-like protein [Lates japonicus]